MIDPGRGSLLKLKLSDKYIPIKAMCFALVWSTPLKISYMNRCYDNRCLFTGKNITQVAFSFTMAVKLTPLQPLASQSQSRSLAQWLLPPVHQKVQLSTQQVASPKPAIARVRTCVQQSELYEVFA